MRRNPALTPVLLAILTLASTALHARTLTAADGRTIEAEVLGFEGVEKVRIKRTDTGQTFLLPIASFAEDDQKTLLAEATKPPPPPNAHDIDIELSRLRFDTRKSSGTGVRATYEDWGYTITVRNLSGKTIEGLRAEYILYLKRDVLEKKGQTEKPPLRSKPGEVAFETLPASGRVSAKSGAITTMETELKPGYVYSDSNDSKTRDTLEGIWVRIYQGEHLVTELSSPAGLAKENTWVTASD